MRPGEKAALLLFTTAAAFASAAVVILADHYGIITISPRPAQQVALSEPTASGAPADSANLDGRLPALLLDEPPPSLAALRGASPEEPSVAELMPEPEQDSARPWTTETVPGQSGRSTVPRVSALPPPRLPWQTPGTAPAPPARTYTLAERLAEISPQANRRITAKFDTAKVSWPPAGIGLVAIKDEKVLELHARDLSGTWHFVHRYRILAASGTPGPKLRQGDKQVPEGVYGISFLNPNSKYHVSLRVDYPNAFDKEMAAKDGRTSLGGDIMIHGKSASIGCLAIGDEAAEDLFVLAASIGLHSITLVIAPTDLRRNSLPQPEAGRPKWLPGLYAQVASAMSDFKAPPSSGLLSLFGL